MKKLICMFTQFVLLLSMFMLAGVSTANAAATATISATSSASTYDVGQQFTATIACNGGGQNFNTCGASVSVSNLTVVSLTKGSAVSLWTTEPSAGSLNFYGGVTGKTGASSLTAYTMKVKGKKVGTASISVSGGSVLLGSDGSDIFVSQRGKSFTIKEVETAPAAATPVVVAPTSPILPDTESALEDNWALYSIDSALDVIVGADTTAAMDSAGDLTGVKLSGNAAPGALVTLYIFSTKLVKSATADANGLWSIILAEALADGSHAAYIISTKDGVNKRIASKLVFTVNAANKTAMQTVEEKATAATTPAATSTTNGTHWYSNLWLWTGVGLVVIILILVWYFWYKKRQIPA